MDSAVDGRSVEKLAPESRPVGRGSDLPVDERLFEDRLEREMLDLFAKNSPMGTAAAIVNIVVIGYVMHGILSPPIWGSWVFGQIGLNLLRFGSTLAYIRSRRSEQDASASRVLCVQLRQRTWVRLFAGGVVLQALGWSVAGAYFFPIGTPIARTFVVVMLAGMVAGGVSLLSPMRRAAYAWVVLLVLPEAFVCLMLDGLWPLFAVCAVLFTVTQLVAVKHAHSRFCDIVRMDLRNQDLVNSLSLTNRELESARDQAMRAAEAKADFLSNMSHEIRTPMTSILGYADLLEEARDEREMSRYRAVIQRNGRHLLALINDILDLSKIEAGRLEPEHIPCRPAEVIESAVDMLSGAAVDSGLRLECRIDDPFPDVIESDPVRLRQILVNLISNALKFTEQGSVQVHARLERKTDDAHLRVSVQDTGIGMSPEQLGNLFQPFTQADAGISRRYGGTGLGLSISRRLAEALGGELWATSEVGAGSRFELELRLGPWDELLGFARTPSARAEVRMASASTPRLSGRVLVAEDGIDNQRLIRTLLERRGLEVDVAPDGRAALQAARRSLEESAPYDLVLMDIQMPELDGARVTETLRSEGWSGPIIALTAQVLKSDRDRFMPAGFDDYATKPLEIPRLDAVLTRYLDAS